MPRLIKGLVKPRFSTRELRERLVKGNEAHPTGLGMVVDLQLDHIEALYAAVNHLMERLDAIEEAIGRAMPGADPAPASAPAPAPTEEPPPAVIEKLTDAANASPEAADAILNAAIKAQEAEKAADERTVSKAAKKKGGAANGAA